jgi:hypothetical protein
MQQDAEETGPSIPDEEAARKKYLHHGAAAPDLMTVKDFIRFYISTSRPQLTDKPTVDSINTVAEWFFAGFTRLTSTETDPEERSAVYNVSDYPLRGKRNKIPLPLTPCSGFEKTSLRKG